MGRVGAVVTFLRDEKGKIAGALPIKTRFLERIMPEPNSGCWLWTGEVVPKLYGRIRRNDYGKYVLAHRLSWELYKGEIPDGLYVCHKCDVPSCVNPEHLFLGTHDDNMADKKNKDRHIRGIRSPLSKLTDDLVKEIRSSSLSQRKLAKIYGVSYHTISQIKLGKMWKHI